MHDVLSFWFIHVVLFFLFSCIISTILLFVIFIYTQISMHPIINFFQGVGIRRCLLECNCSIDAVDTSVILGTCSLLCSVVSIFFSNLEASVSSGMWEPEHSATFYVLFGRVSRLMVGYLQNPFKIFVVSREFKHIYLHHVAIPFRIDTSTRFN